MLDALDYQIRKDNGERFRFAFNSASAGHTALIGRAFAPVVMQTTHAGSPWRDVLRVGILAARGMGKSSFVNGLLEAFPDKHSVEMVYDPRHYNKQDMWRMGDGIWLRHCDAGYREKQLCLTSYWNNTVETGGLPFRDIVEHPHWDKNDPMFDCLVMISHLPASRQIRVIEVEATPELERAAEFRAFLQEASACKP